MQYLRGKHLLLACSLLASATAIFAQNPADNSPYTRYGLGSLTPTVLQGQQAMGGIGAGYQTLYSLNTSNPASLSFLGTTAFETGIFARYNRLATNGLTAHLFNGNLSHLALAFPLKNPINRAAESKKSPWNVGMSVGLQPYSTVGYNIQTTDSLADIGKITYTYQGAGGLYRLFWGVGAKYKHFAFGAEATYLFGQTAYQRAVSCGTSTNAFSDVLTDRLNYRGFLWKGGVQYQHVFGENTDGGAVSLRDPKTRLTLGATGTLAANVNVTGAQLAERTNTYYGRDTIVFDKNVATTAKFPASWSAGAVLSKDFHWLVGVNIARTAWGNYTNPAKPDVLLNTWRASVGGEYLPDAQSYNKYSQRMTYRLGGYYGNDPRVVGGEQIYEYAATLGVGLPMEAGKRGVVGYTNLTLEVGQQGTPSGIKDTFVKIGIGFTLNDNTWFYKQRFN